MRTTFFTLELVGPRVPWTAVPAGGTPEYARMARLAEKTSTIRTGQRAGVWRVQSLQRLASRSGARLVRATTMARDDKGLFDERTII